MKTEISSLFSLNIYTESGIYVGKINDIVIDVNKRKVTELGLFDINRTIHDVPTPGILIPYRLIVSIGDIVIVRDVVGKSIHA